MKKIIWAAEPNAITAYLEKRETANNDEFISAKDLFARQEATDIFDIKGEEAIIRINGVLTQDGPDFIDNLFGLAVTGYNQLIEAINLIKADDSIKSVKLAMDTPGGEASGCDLVFQALQDLGKTKKIKAFNFGMIASAGYWLAIAADEIIATSPSNETGSIGVIITGFDFTGFYESFGVKFVRIRSKNAPNKAPGISSKEDIKLLQDRIDSLERIFISRVASGRNVSEDTVIKSFGKGGVFVAEDPDKKMPDAVSVGMIDSVMSKLEINNDNRKQKIKSKYLKEDKMDLTQLMSDNPGLKEAIEKLENTSYARGVEDTNKLIKVRTEKAAPILQSDAYDSVVKGLAIKVITGEEEASALTSVVTIMDSQAEKEKATIAAAEAEELKETPPEAPEGEETKEIISEDDIKQEAKNLGNPGGEDN